MNQIWKTPIIMATERRIGMNDPNQPACCPYCGSVENNGDTCKWCSNIINTEEKNYEHNQDDRRGFGGNRMEDY